MAARKAAEMQAGECESQPRRSQTLLSPPVANPANSSLPGLKAPPVTQLLGRSRWQSITAGSHQNGVQQATLHWLTGTVG